MIWICDFCVAGGPDKCPIKMIDNVLLKKGRLSIDFAVCLCYGGLQEKGECEMKKERTIKEDLDAGFLVQVGEDEYNFIPLGILYYSKGEKE